MWIATLVMGIGAALMAWIALIGTHERYRPELTIPLTLVLGLIAAAGFNTLASISGG
jgi:hypothetical protein